MTEQLDKIISRVNGLLAKAASTNFPAEAEALRSKADELMTNYAIEQWQLERAQRTASGAKPIAVREDFDLSWYWEIRDEDISRVVYSVYWEVAQHCRVEPAYLATDYSNRTMPLVGMKPDVEYMKILFTDLFRQMMDAMDPRPRAGESKEEALAKMKEAGLKWEVIYNRLVKAELQEDLGPWTSSVASKVNYAGLYTKFCERTGRHRNRIAPSVYRRSFTHGFYQGVCSQFLRMRTEQGQSTGSMALALKDYRQDVKDALYEFFPEHKPKEPTEEELEQERKQSKKRRRTARPKQKTISFSAVLDGRTAGESVSIISGDDANRQRISGELS